LQEQMATGFDELPNMPSLERAEIPISCDYGVPLGCVLVVGTVVWWWATGQASIAIAVIAAILALVASVCWLTTGTVKLDETGISYRRPLRRAHMKWQDISEARMSVARLVSIKSNSSSIRFSLASDIYHAKAEASLWQHLRRYGKVAGFHVSDIALSIWGGIPQDIPEEMDYCDDAPFPTRYELRADHIIEEYAAERHTDLRWSDVVGAEFGLYGGDYDNIYFILEARDGQKMHIMAIQSDANNAAFLLSVIRRARDIDTKPAIPILDDIREVCGVKLPVLGSEAI
jgi:hypothetical protein